MKPIPVLYFLSGQVSGLDQVVLPVLSALHLHSLLADHLNSNQCPKLLNEIWFISKINQE